MGRTDLDNDDNRDALIARFNTNGNLDNTFGNNGVVTNIPNDSFSYSSVAVQADGKIVVAVTTDLGNNLRYAVIARFNPDGSLDKLFDTINIDEGYNSVAIDDDGKIIAVGGVIRGADFEPDSLIARFLPNGVLDAESKSNLKSFRESAKNNNIPIALLG